MALSLTDVLTVAPKLSRHSGSDIQTAMLALLPSGADLDDWDVDEFLLRILSHRFVEDIPVLALMYRGLSPEAGVLPAIEVAIDAIVAIGVHIDILDATLDGPRAHSREDVYSVACGGFPELLLAMHAAGREPEICTEMPPHDVLAWLIYGLVRKHENGAYVVDIGMLERLRAIGITPLGCLGDTEAVLKAREAAIWNQIGRDPYSRLRSILGFDLIDNVSRDHLSEIRRHISILRRWHKADKLRFSLLQRALLHRSLDDNTATCVITFVMGNACMRHSEFQA